MLTDYFTWWTEQMLGWVPAQFRRANCKHGTGNALIIQFDELPDGHGIGVVSRRQRQERALGRFELDGASLRTLKAAVPARPAVVVLRLPRALLLEREVVLPLAAEREGERVLTYEMDRVTPFAATDVFWTYVVMQRDRAHGRLHLRLSIVTRASVQTLLGALTEAGLAPTLLEVENAAGITRRIALQRPDSRRERLGRRMLAAAALVCLVLAVAVVGFPFFLQWAAGHRIETQVAALRSRVAEVEALRLRVVASAAGMDAAEAERARVGDALAVLAVLTQALPDDTYLEDFALRQGKLTVNGQSAAAVRLISALSDNKVIRNPEFVAPVTRVNAHEDLFSIRAEVTR